MSIRRVVVVVKDGDGLDLKPFVLFNIAWN